MQAKKREQRKDEKRGRASEATAVLAGADHERDGVERSDAQLNARLCKRLEHEWEKLKARKQQAWKERKRSETGEQIKR